MTFNKNILPTLFLLIILIFTISFSLDLKKKQEDQRKTLETRVTELESKVKLLAKKVNLLEEKVENPPLKIIPVK